MEGNAVLWLILIIGGLTLVYLLIRYVINRGVDKATDAIHNSRVRSKNEQAGSVYNAPVQRNAAVTGSASAISAGSDSSPVLREGVQYLRDWYPDYRPAHIRHGLQGYTSTDAVPTAPMPDPLPEKSETTASVSKVIPVPSAASQPKSARCCLCGDALEKQYAVLFVAKDGSEMRVDRKCYEELRDLGTSEDVATVRKARFSVFQKGLAARNKELAAYLDRFLASADAYLQEKES